MRAFLAIAFAAFSLAVTADHNSRRHPQTCPKIRRLYVPTTVSQTVSLHRGLTKYLCFAYDVSGLPLARIIR